MKKLLRYIIFYPIGLVVVPTTQFLSWLVDPDDVPTWEDYKDALNL